jgi:hypothetical protein
MPILLTIVLLGITPGGAPPPAESLGQRWAQILRGEVAHASAWGLQGGMAYDWADLGFGQLTVSHLYDYEHVWLHDAPPGLGIRFEGTLGAAGGSEFSGARLMTSAGFLAVYEFQRPPAGEARFYVEGGVGLIYTDFQREDQGLRVNFNPVAGLGWRWPRQFLTLRLHHISNGGLHPENRGINSVVLGWGRYLADPSRGD